MQVNKEFILREIAGEHLIIPTGKTVLNFNGLIVVNSIGQFIWDNIQEEITFDQLIDRILEEYEVDRDTAESDAASFLDELVKAEILEDYK